jgi:POT family proton-dependent oligopeptide transporter
MHPATTIPTDTGHNEPHGDGARKMPPQIPYIIGNEGCERFSFYGMRNVLTTFLVSYLLTDVAEADRATAAKDVMHTFIIGVYFFPLLGGWLADRFLGKYTTIFALSLVYCVGHAFLAIFESWRPGFYAGLGLIALGSGGIKPCVSSFVGDQFTQRNKHLAKVVFDAFYWIINFGSFFASLLIPLLLKRFGPSIAFGVPGLLMFIATVVLWLGRKQYVMVPAQPADPHAFSKVIKTALFAGTGSRSGLVLVILGIMLAAAALSLVGSLGFVPAVCIALVSLLLFGGIGASRQLDHARGVHPDDEVEGARAVLRILVLFALVTPFWSLFDQKTSTWVIQASSMTKPDWFQPSQMQALNPLLVMLLIPFNNLVLYPGLVRLGFRVTALRRMTAGIAFAGLSWIVVGGLQLALDGGVALGIVWQILPYAILTFGEVLVSATGLEFAYSQAPPRMKGVLMSFWSLSVTVGNLWVLLANAAVKNDVVTAAIGSSGLSVVAFQMFFFAAFAFVAAAVFGLVAARYSVVDRYRS